MCDGEHRSRFAISCDFQAQNPSFLWEFWRFGSVNSRAAKGGVFKRGGFPIWTCPSFFVLFCPFSDFPDFSGISRFARGWSRGFSRFVLFLFLSLLRAPTRNSPERVRDTIWTFPEKSGKHPGLETPRFSFSQSMRKSLAVRFWCAKHCLQQYFSKKEVHDFARNYDFNAQCLKRG